MADVKRYHSPLRQRQAEESRRAVLAAARDLFVEQGYGATTIEQVAARAGVSKPTVFNAVGNKVALLRTVRDVAMAGDDEPVSVTARDSVTAIAEAVDLDDACRACADHVAALLERYHRVHAVLSGAAGTDPELAGLAGQAETERHTGAGHLLSRLEQHGASRGSRTQDLLWLLMAPDTYTRLVELRGWSPGAYRAWLAQQIRQLFPTDLTAPSGTPPVARPGGSPATR
jgi:AcrR family transcriptional regulator